MKIYVVMLYNLGNNEAIGTFSSEEKAKEFAKAEHDYWGLPTYLEAFELDGYKGSEIIDLGY